MSEAWIVIGALAVTTAMIRAAGPVLMGERDLHPRLAGVVDLLAPALLTALIVVEVFGAGDEIEVSTPEGTVSYTVERTERYAKGELPDAAEVWEASPGRLVLITCFQRGGGRASTENLVVFAEA